MKTHEREVSAGERFEFGKNWLRFLEVLNEDRIGEAERSLRAMLEVDELKGKSFLDVGSGSGIFSLAAARLAAGRIHSFDFDPQSVACTRELKRRYMPQADHWTIEEGSVLDPAFLSRLGQFDIVYAWGVLHHTGNMWQAFENVSPLVAPRGRLFVAVYNDQGWVSRLWRRVKSFYNRGLAHKLLVAGVFIPMFIARGLVGDGLHLRNPLSRYRNYKKVRGMSIVHDWLDWLGGLPFEVAQAEEVFEYYKRRGFSLAKLKTCGGNPGNNQFVFVRCDPLRSRPITTSSLG